MTLLVSELVGIFSQFVWPLIRISAVLLTGPFFSLAAVSYRIRIAVVLVLTWIMFPLVDVPEIDPLSFGAITGVLHEVFVGGLMGLTLQVVIAALVVGGQVIAGSMGLSMANMIDPNLGNVPTLSQFFLIIGTLLFMSLGGHLVILSVLYSSFELLPIASGRFNTDMILSLMTWSSQIFISAVVIAFPIMIGLLLVNALLGLVSRAAPSLNVFAIGFPALIPVGLIMLLLTMGIWFEQVENLWFRGFNSVNEILGAG
jgi:flagellar biosynthetic protein FliR